MVFFIRVVTGRSEINPTVISRIRGRIRTITYTIPSNPDITLFLIRPCTSATVQRSFLNRICTIWNALAADLGLSTSCYLNSLKAALYVCYKQAPVPSYIPDDPRSSKSTCLVTLAVIQDEKLPVACDSTVSVTYFSDLCLRLAVIGSCCYDVPACARVNIYLLLLVVSC